MFESKPTGRAELPPDEKKKELRREMILRLLLRNETFPFTAGIKESAYQKMKAESEEFPGFVTHIDELVKRFRSEGFKIVVTGGVNVFAMPALCDSTSSKDIEENTVFLKFFEVTDEMDPDLRSLIDILTEQD